MLRHNACAYRALVADGREARRTRRKRTAAALDRLGYRVAGNRRRYAADNRRRAHQRARQPQIQTADREGKYEEAAEIGRLQVRRGAHILDVCVQDPDRNESADMSALLSTLVRKVKVPLMIDTTDAVVIEEVAEARARQVAHQFDQPGRRRGALRTRGADCAPIWRRAGGRLYRRGQAAGAGRHARSQAPIAERSYRLLTENYGIAPEDIIFDPLVFPVGTGDRNYIGSALRRSRESG